MRPAGVGRWPTPVAVRGCQGMIGRASRRLRTAMTLEEYRRKRNFSKTAEPAGDAQALAGGSQFVVQKHAASRLHYDFRLELDGVLLSWAVPKGPSLDPAVKALAVQVEDHPLEYAGFEGIIAPGEYGAGTVMVWDRGIWQPEGDPREGYRRGNLKFRLAGEKLRGRWALVRMNGEDGKNWLLIKHRDKEAIPGDKHGLEEREPDSVLSGRSMEQIAADADSHWDPSRPAKQAQRPGLAPAQSKRSKRAKSPTPGSVNLKEIARAIKALPEAKAAKLPRSLEPQLATLSSAVPTGEDWLHELKFDGYRLLAWADGKLVRLMTRRGQDWTDRFSATAAAIAALGLKATILDGELVALDEHGVSQFQELQNWLRKGRTAELVYYVFDAPFLLGYDLRATPLIERKQALARVLLAHDPTNAGPIRYSDHVVGQGPAFRGQACDHGLEGVVSKRTTAQYQAGRSPQWRKLKCHNRQEFVVAGYTQPQGSRSHFGALLLGYYRDGSLVYCGRVGTGFNQQTLRAVGKQLKVLRREDCPYDVPPPRAARRGVTWVEPELVAEVEFSGWTEDGVLRHPSFQGLREDKEPRDVVREQPNAGGNGASTAHKQANGAATNGKHKSANKPSSGNHSGHTIAGVRLTNPDRVLYPEMGLTKEDLARFYEQIADWALPYLVNRPLTLVRCPQGAGKTCFYQKHWSQSMPPAVKSVRVPEKTGHQDYVLIDDLPGLISLVQIGALEFHPWPARADRLDRPDMMVFDLDPGEGVDWDQVKQAARDVRMVLEELGLQSWVRTTGGKGLHVVVPLARRNTWDDVSGFAQQVAQALVRAAPERYVATMRKQLRSGKVFIDYFRNAQGATSVASYSTRSRAGAPVATPLAWDELDAVSAGNQFHVGNLPQRLQRLATDPWEGFGSARQSLTKDIRRKAAGLTG